MREHLGHSLAPETIQSPHKHHIKLAPRGAREKRPEGGTLGVVARLVVDVFRPRPPLPRRVVAELGKLLGVLALVNWEHVPSREGGT